ncbi:MAG: glycosyltransferase [Phycisphaerae bacterium]
MNRSSTNGTARPHILVSGWYGHNNLGDEAILDVLIAELGRRLGSCLFTVITEAVSSPQTRSLHGYPVRWLPHHSPYRLPNVPAPRLWAGFVRCWAAVATCDLFILGGGGLLRDNFRRSNLLRLLDDVFWARLTGTPAAVFAIGAGPFVTGLGKRLIRSLVHVARSVSVRDEISAAALRSIGVAEGRIRIVGDPALLLRAAPQIELPERNDRVRVAICPCQGMLTGFRGGAAGNPRLSEILAHAADRIVEHLGAEVWLIPFCRASANDNDVVLCREIQERMARRDRAVLVTDVLDAPRTKAMLEGMHVVVGARLHSLIFAASGGVPCVGINYEPKVRGFMRAVGLEDYCIDPLQATPDEIVRLVRGCVEHGSRLAEVIASHVAAWQGRTNAALDQLAGLALSHAGRRGRRAASGSKAAHAASTRRLAGTDAGPTAPGTVSVVIPAYNAAPYIADAIDSVLAQTHPAHEIIVVDDGSTDDTVGVVRRYGDRVILLQQPNRGPAAARNAGIRRATGEFIAFLDADDIWTDRNLELQVRILSEHPGYVLSYGYVRRFVGSVPPELRNATPHDGSRPQGDVSTALVHDTIWATCAALIRRSVLVRTGGFDEELRVGEDYDLWLRIAGQGPVACVPHYVGAIRLHPESVTRSQAFRTTPPEVCVIRRHLDRAPELRERVGRRALRRRLAKCYTDLSLHDLQRNLLAASLLHCGVGMTIAPTQARTVGCYVAAMVRCVLRFTVGLRSPRDGPGREGG